MNPNALVSAVITGAVGCVVDVASASHRYAVPVSDDVTKLQSSESGVIRILNPLTETGEQFCYVLLGGGGESTPSDAPATVHEPLRRPLFRNIAPNPHADEHTPEGNAARCMGTIQLPGKTYQPIRALDENGQPAKDEEDSPLYVKRREPKTGSGRFVLRIDGKTSEGIEWIYCGCASLPMCVPSPVPH